MAPENWPRVKEIVGEALEHAPDQRAAFLDAACAQDAGLRKEVDSLLAVQGDAAALPCIRHAREAERRLLVIGGSIRPRCKDGCRNGRAGR